MKPQENNPPEPKPFIPCALCYGRGMVSAVSREGRSASFRCGCGNGTNLPENYAGRTWQQWGESWRLDGWAIVQPGFNGKWENPEQRATYTARARDLQRKAMAKELSGMTLATAMFSMAVDYPGLGWFENAAEVLKSHCERNGIADYKSLIPNI